MAEHKGCNHHPAGHGAEGCPECIRSERGGYADFVDELHRLNLIDVSRRNFLKKSMWAAGGALGASLLAAGGGNGLQRALAAGPEEGPSTGSAPEKAFKAEQKALEAGLVKAVGSGLYEVKSGVETVHWGYLSGSVDPILRINSGDTVVMETVSHEGILEDQGDPVAFFAKAGFSKEQILADVVAIYQKVQHSGAGPHVVTGPIYINGAEPGDVLEVRILEAEPRVPYGVNSMRLNKGGLPGEFTLNRSMVIPFDMERRVGLFSQNIEVPLKPFFGIMATGPAKTLGKISSVPPGAYAGNIDLNELTAGTTFYIPVHVKGALFFAGDGHAAQGDGEVDLTAIETSLRGKFQFIVRKDMRLIWPRAETPTHWITIGLHEDLDEAMRMAIRETIDFLVKEKGLTREDAYALASVAIDFEVTQVVDGVKGIHAMIPKSIFKA